MTFDPGLLIESLKGLSTKHRVAFAASCAERLLPNYKKFFETEGWGDYDLLRKTLDSVWSYLVDDAVLDINILIGECDRVIPDTEDFETIYASFALDAGNAIVETLQFLQDNNDGRLIDIASFCRDTVDMFIQEINDMNYSDPEFEVKIATHPLMVRELKKQTDDIVLLQNQKVLDKIYLKMFQESIRGKSNIE